NITLEIRNESPNKLYQAKDLQALIENVFLQAEAAKAGGQYQQETNKSTSNANPFKVSNPFIPIPAEEYKKKQREITQKTDSSPTKNLTEDAKDKRSFINWLKHLFRS
ncbi:hypothetical protein ACFLZV_07170, partial [Candidatus Margulisiibacteriota bacterium]